MIEAAVESALAPVELAGESLVWAAMARRHARLMDLAWGADDVSAYLRGAVQLRELLDLLPVRGPAGAGDVPEGGSHDGSPRGQVLQLLDSPPSVGDAAE